MKDLKIIDDKFSVINNMASFLGISGENAEKLFEILNSKEYSFAGQELIAIQEESDDKSILFMGGLYSLNIKATTLVVLAVLLDMKVTNGMAGMIIQLTGLGKQGIAKLNEYLGERCIAREAALLKEIDKNVLDANHGECVNNDLECKFQEKGECRCTFTEVEKIIDKLEKEGVLELNKKTKRYGLVL